MEYACRRAASGNFETFDTITTAVADVSKLSATMNVEDGTDGTLNEGAKTAKGNVTDDHVLATRKAIFSCVFNEDDPDLKACDKIEDHEPFDMDAEIVKELGDRGLLAFGSSSVQQLVQDASMDIFPPSWTDKLVVSALTSLPEWSVDENIVSTLLDVAKSYRSDVTKWANQAAEHAAMHLIFNGLVARVPVNSLPRSSTTTKHLRSALLSRADQKELATEIYRVGIERIERNNDVDEAVEWMVLALDGVYFRGVDVFELIHHACKHNKSETLIHRIRNTTGTLWSEIAEQGMKRNSFGRMWTKEIINIPGLMEALPSVYICSRLVGEHYPHEILFGNRDVYSTQSLLNFDPHAINIVYFAFKAWFGEIRRQFCGAKIETYAKEFLEQVYGERYRINGKVYRVFHFRAGRAMVIDAKKADELFGSDTADYELWAGYREERLVFLLKSIVYKYRERLIAHIHRPSGTLRARQNVADGVWPESVRYGVPYHPKFAERADPERLAVFMNDQDTVADRHADRAKRTRSGQTVHSTVLPWTPELVIQRDMTVDLPGAGR